MKNTRFGLIAFAMLAVAGLPFSSAKAAVDNTVCSAADSGGTSCSASQFKSNASEEIGALSNRAPFKVTVSGTNSLTGCPTPRINTYVDGMTMQFRPVANNTGPMDVNICGVGVVDLVTAAGVALGSGEVLASTVYEATYSHADIQWRLKGGGSAGGSGAPDTASYVALGFNSTLTSERVLTAGTGISLTDNGANSTVLVNVSDTEINCILALTSAADKIAYYTGSGTCALADLSTYARTLIDDADAATARSTLGLVIGTNVQAFDADLASLAANSTAGFWTYTGAGTGAARTLTAPAAGLTISNPAGTAGNPTFALANDLAALEALSGTNTIYYRSAADTWTGVTIGSLLSFSAGTLNVGDAELTSIAGLVSAADKGIQFTGSGTAATYDLTTAGKALLDDASASAQRTTLGLGTMATETATNYLTTATAASTYQPLDSELTALAGLVSAADRLPYFTGSGTSSLATFTAFGRSLADDTDASTARSTLGLVIGTNVQAFDADLTTWATLTPSANTQSLVTAADYSAMRTLLALVPGTNVQAFDADLSTWAGLTPSANAQSFVVAADYAAMRSLLSLVPGTNVQAYNARLGDIAGATWNQGDLLYFNGTNLVDLAPGTSGQFLKTNGAGANPSWETIAGGGDLLSTNNLSDVANAGTARTNLGLAIGTNVQAFDADLTTWAGLTPTANAQSLVTAVDYAAMRALLDLEAGTDFYSVSGANSAFQPLDSDLTTWAGVTPSANGQSLVAAANYAAMRGLLDLEAGTDFYSVSGANAAFQPLDSDLTTWAGLAPSANGQSLVTAANYAAMRGLLDLEAGTDFYSIAAADSAFIAASEIDTSSELRAIIGDEVGTGALMFGLSATMSDDLSCTGSQVVRRNSGDTAFECATVSGAGDMVAANNLSDVASAATAFANIKQNASETATGVVELATTTEAETGTDTTRAVTPAGVAAAIAAAPGGGAKLIAIGSLTGTETDNAVLGDTYKSLFIKATCFDTSGPRALRVAISDDGSTFGSAINLMTPSGTATKLSQVSATISNTGVGSTDKTVTPHTLVVSDIDAIGSTSLYTTTGTETSENGITHTIQLSGSGGWVLCTWEVWGTQ